MKRKGTVCGLLRASARRRMERNTAGGNCSAAQGERDVCAPRDAGNGCLLVYMTVPEAEGSALARTLVWERLAAGVNVVPGLRSCYWWEGDVRERGECLLLAQTTRERFPALRARVRALHSDVIPCIVTVPLAGGHAPFLTWVAAEAAPAARAARQRQF